MTVPSNTIQNVNRVGVREDLSNKIAELFPDDTPFLNAIGTGKCSATKTEWQTDGLANANANNSNEASTSTSTTGGMGNLISSLTGIGNMLGGSGGLLQAIKPSDIRVKRDIRPIGTLDDGLGVYAYRYRWSDEPQIGVMAQEVAALRPWALGPVTDGYLTVDYGAL